MNPLWLCCVPFCFGLLACRGEPDAADSCQTYCDNLPDVCPESAARVQDCEASCEADPDSSDAFRQCNANAKSCDDLRACKASN